MLSLLQKLMVACKCNVSIGQPVKCRPHYMLGGGGADRYDVTNALLIWTFAIYLHIMETNL